VTVRLGVLGAGLIARYHVASLAASGADARIVSVFDPDAGRATALAASCGARVAVREADVYDGVDALYVCTWTACHAEQVAAAAERGLAVFCEKPLAFDAAGATAMLEAVEQAGVVHQVGLVLRSVPGFALLRALATDPAAGRVMTVVFRDDQQIPLGPPYGSVWRADRTKAGAGTLLEHSIHDLDLLEWLCGPLVSVSAYSSNLHGHPGIEDSVAVSVRFAGGGTGVLTSTWHDIGGRVSNRRVEILRERERLQADGNAGERVAREVGPGAVSEWTSAADQLGQLRSMGRAVPVNADAAFVAAVRDGTPASPGFEVAVRAHRLADAVYASAAADGTPQDVTPPT
jgi:predicted dehydrogenase